MLPSDSPGSGAGLNEHAAAEDGRERGPSGQAPAGGQAQPGGGRRAGRALKRARALAASALAPVIRGLRRLRPALPAADGQVSRARSADVPGALFARLTVLPALLILAWLIPGLPLLLGRGFQPVPELLISAPLAVVLAVNGLRVVPSRWPRLLSADRKAEPVWATWFGLLATVAVVAGLTAWQLTEGSEALIVLRGPGTYMQAGYWIAQHGSLPIPQMLTAFGGAHPGLNFTSTGFLARGTSLYPSATPALPLLLAGGFWVHGITGATATGPVLGGLAMLAFAGLAGRLVGPQWAPAGALVLGLSLPQQYVGRTSLSETALQVMLFGALCLLADSLALRGVPAAAARRLASGIRHTAGEADAVLASSAPVSTETSGTADTAVLFAPVLERRRFPARISAAMSRLVSPPRRAPWLTPQRMLAGLAGLSLGFGLLISLDAIPYLIPVIPVGCALIVGRRPQAATFLAGCLVGVCYGIVGCYLLDRPFLDSVGRTTALGGVVAVWLITMCFLVTQLARVGRLRAFVRKMLAGRPLRWLPEAGAVLAFAVLIGFAVRPYVQTVRGHPGLAEHHFIESLQRLQGLPVDPTRLYSEQTLYWVIWYIGLPTVLLGAFGLALLVRRTLRSLLTWRDPTGVWREWGLPLAIICTGSAVVLWAPDVVPDQPWASRRLIVMAIPGLIICALWAASWLGRRARDRGARPATAGAAGVFCVAAMLVPTVSTTFGLGLSHSGKSGGLTPVAQGLALTRTGAGEISAIANLCAQIPHDASVVIVGWPTAPQFTQTIRGMCGVPVGWMAGQPVSSIDAVVASISAAGRRPLLLAATPRKLAAFGGTPVRVLDLTTTEDPHELTQLPTAPQPVHYQVWMTAPGNSGIGT